MATINQQQVIALAAIVQAASLTDRIACTGQYDVAAFDCLLNSLFKFDADSAADIYNQCNGLEPGLRALIDICEGKDASRYRAAVRYAMAMLHLQKQLMQRDDLLGILHSRLQHTERNLKHYANDINQIYASVAAIYKDTISTFKFRIQVNGSMQQLQNPVNSDKIRTLLLCGIRAAVLWRQTGGKRWQLLFKRRAIADIAKQLLQR